MPIKNSIGLIIHRIDYTKSTFLASQEKHFCVNEKLDMRKNKILFSFLVPSRMGAYGPWSACSVRCGTGTMTRSRSCIQGNQCSTPCQGPTTETRSCGTPVGKQKKSQNKISMKILTNSASAGGKICDPCKRCRKLEHHAALSQHDGSLEVVLAHFFLLFLYTYVY